MQTPYRQSSTQTCGRLVPLWASADTTNIAERVFEDLRTEPHVYLLPDYEDAESAREVLDDFWQTCSPRC